MLSFYMARAMSGREGSEVRAEAVIDNKFLEKAGFKVLCPVTREGIKNTKKIIQASEKDVRNDFWPTDKKMIQECHILFHMSPHLNSAGAWQEVGYMRYHLQGPVVHIYPTGKLPSGGAIPRIENDYVCDSLEEAIEYSLRVHGTYLKRLTWRLKNLNRCIIKSVIVQAKRWLK